MSVTGMGEMSVTGMGEMSDTGMGVMSVTGMGEMSVTGTGGLAEVTIRALTEQPVIRNLTIMIAILLNKPDHCYKNWITHILLQPTRLATDRYMHTRTYKNTRNHVHPPLSLSLSTVIFSSSASLSLNHHSLPLSLPPHTLFHTHTHTHTHSCTPPSPRRPSRHCAVSPGSSKQRDNGSDPERCSLTRQTPIQPAESHKCPSASSKKRLLLLELIGSAPLTTRRCRTNWSLLKTAVQSASGTGQFHG